MAADLVGRLQKGINKGITSEIKLTQVAHVPQGADECEDKVLTPRAAPGSAHRN